MYDTIYACMNKSNRCSQATPAKKKDKKNVYLVSVLPFQPRSFPSQFRPEGRWLAWSDNSETPHPGGHAPLAHGMGGDGGTYS